MKTGRLPHRGGGLRGQQLALARLRGERGAVLPIVAVTCVVLVLVAGLLLDYGRVIVYRTQFQAFCEAAAHAGAQEADVYRLTGSNPPVWVVKVRQDDARREALACLDENLAGLDLQANSLSVLSKFVTFPADDRVRVEVEVEGRTFFARVLGGQYGQVRFRAGGEAYANAGP